MENFENFDIDEFLRQYEYDMDNGSTGSSSSSSQQHSKGTVSVADALDFDKMHITGYKNGELRQEGWSADMIHDIPALVTFLSGCCTLEPGDVILTGTPSGVILGRPEDQQDWLQPGDVLTVKEDTIGELTVTIQDS